MISESGQDIVLKVEKLSKSFGAKKVLSSISMTLLSAERLAILGPSGCGKSVLLRCIAGLDLPDKEAVVTLLDERTNIAQVPIIKRAKFNKFFSMLFQADALFDSMSVFQNIAFPLKYNLKIKDQGLIRDAVMSELDAVELERSCADKRPSELSGGMKKRVAIARAIITRPKIVFLDEPTAGLDPLTAIKIGRLITRLNESTGTSMIVVTHDIHCLAAVAQRNILLDDGKIVASGTTDELRSMADKSDFISAFFSTRIEEMV